MHRAREERAYTIEQLPGKDGYEVAIIGRSNVGKSCLMNALLSRRTAQVSQKPGCTLWIGIHHISNATVLDLPGYGYARTGKQRRSIVDKLVTDYFKLNRTNMVLMLIDLRRGIMDIDEEIMNYISQYGIPITLIGTKADKKGANACNAVDMVCSSVKGSGIQEIKDYITSRSSSTSCAHLAGKS